MAEALAKKAEHTLSDGSRVFFESLDEIEIDENPSETSVHEAWHVLAALLLGVGVKEVTNIPEGNAAGATFLSGYDARVFAAAHAMGCRGGGHDLSVITMMEGATDGAIAGAQSLLSGSKRYKQMLAIATLLDKKRRMGGSESLAILNDVMEEQDEGKLYIMRVVRPDGTEEVSTERIQNTEKAARELVTLIQITEQTVKKPNTGETSDIVVLFAGLVRSDLLAEDDLRKAA